MAETTDGPMSQAYFLTAPALETAFALGALLWHQRRRFATQWAESLEAQLSAEEQAWVASLRRLPEHFILGDLAVHHRCFQDPLELALIVAEMDPAAFTAKWLSEQIKPEQVEEYQAAPDGPVQLRKQFPWLWAGDEGTIRTVLLDGPTLQQAIAGLLPRVWELGVKPMLPKLEPLWSETLRHSEVEAAGKEPKALGLSVFPIGFGKRFGPDHIFPQMLFIPTYFLSPTRVAFTEFDIAVLTLDCRLGPWAVQKRRAELIDRLRAITEENRLEILRLLAAEKGFGGWVAGRLKVNPATVTHHITQLRKAGLLVEADGPPGAAKYFKTDRSAIRRLFKQIEEYLDGDFEPES